jgi:2-methylcitrate dehydratase PrpD
MEARFSLTYCAARVLQTGSLTLSDMTLKRVRDDSVRPWLRRFLIHTNPGSVSDELRGANATPAITRIVLKSGRVHEIGILAPKGSRQAPLTEDDRRGKFQDCCQWAGRGDDANRLFALARSIQELARFPEFSQGLAQAFPGI